jgi:hypothetical protein
MPGMSKTNDFAKRRFADFIAARLSARRIGRDEQGRIGRESGHATSPRADDESPRASTNADPGLKEIPLSNQA